MTDPAEIKSLAMRLARELGFVRAGVADAARSPRAGRFRRFLELGYHARMAYLARGSGVRADPSSLLPGAASVICLAASYAPLNDDGASGHVARYARGRDYHRLLRRRCRKLLAELTAAEPDLHGRVCVDTAPILERDLAAAAGLGWIGRNGCLIDRRHGSYLLLAEVIIDVPLEPDAPQPSRCGSCRACIDACPTGAIDPDGLVDSRRCVSYLTIEHRGEIPPELRRGCGKWVFGCDVCQQVCPHNRPGSVPPGDAVLIGPSELAQATPAAVLKWTQGDWDRLTRGSAARRASWKMFLRNASVAAANAADPAAPDQGV